MVGLEVVTIDRYLEDFDVRIRWYTYNNRHLKIREIKEFF